MKSNYKLKLFTAIIVLGVSLGNAVAFTPTLIQTTTHAENSDNWVQVQNNNGIIIYFSEYQLDGKSYLKIKFENTSNKTIDYSWSLIKKSETIISNSKKKINALSAINVIENNKLIPFNAGDSYADYSIQIQIK